MRILLFGGLGTNKEYFSQCYNVFYEFDNRADHFERIKKLLVLEKENNNNNEKLCIIAFSLSCYIVTNAVKETQTSCQLHLVDPPMGASIAPRATNMSHSLVYSPWYAPIWYLLALAPVTASRMISWLDNSPPSVNEAIIRLGQDGVRRMLDMYLLTSTTLTNTNNANNTNIANNTIITNIIHIYTGSKSPFYNFAVMLSDMNPMLRLHVVQGCGHHILNKEMIILPMGFN